MRPFPIPVLLILLLASAVAIAQHPDWNMKGLQEVNSKLGSFPAQDRDIIAKRLNVRSTKLLAKRLDAPSGRLFVVQGTGDMLCGGTGNCTTWILSNKYRVLATTIAESVKIQTSLHHGLPDLLTSMNGSAFSGDLTEWNYDGNRYRRIACAGYDSADTNGNLYPQPHVTNQPCRR